MEKIDPALPKIPPTEIVNDVVFQSMLSSWLEEKGFIQDIRSQIRLQLVNVLKNTVLGRNTCRKLSNNKSVSKQALNMIVAEYLLESDYHYSLSVFSAESSLVNIIPDNILQNSESERIFKHEDILNIFELLGISKTGMGQQILYLYYKQPQSRSILCCLIDILNMQMGDNYKVTESSSQNLGISNEFIPVKQIYSRNKSRNPLDSNKGGHNIDSKHIEELTKYIKEREITEKLMKDLSKSNEMLKKGLFELAKDYDILKTRKVERGDSLNQENLNDKNDFSKNDIVNLEKKSCCILPHCGDKCRYNSTKLEELDKKNCILKKENIDLKIRNMAQQKEITRLSTRCNNLVNAIANSEYKLLPISSKANIKNGAPFKLAETENSNSKNNADLQNCELALDSLTEEIVRETWYRLEILDDQSKKIEELFSFVKTK